jgi:hypothetical protein
MYILLEKQTQGDYNESRKLEPVFMTPNIAVAEAWVQKADIDQAERGFYLRDYSQMTVLDDTRDMMLASAHGYVRGIY